LPDAWPRSEKTFRFSNERDDGDGIIDPPNPLSKPVLKKTTMNGSAEAIHGGGLLFSRGRLRRRFLARHR
jgi:hypothetical protein